MSRLLFGLQFRLVVGFTLVMTLALAGVGLSVGYAAKREAHAFQEEVEAVRVARMEDVVSRLLANKNPTSDVHTALDDAGKLYGWRIVLRDREGRLVADSHGLSGRLVPGKVRGYRWFNVKKQGEDLGWAQVSKDELPVIAPEPGSSVLVAAFNQSAALEWRRRRRRGRSAHVAALTAHPVPGTHSQRRRRENRTGETCPSEYRPGAAMR